ncbi:hypothetical protein WME99_04830 [Sorangium sp. So ce136]|uniref:hypothetical protein n=1 Tax=Sorangium sp. So ce136 TaxID=3133284 RepID=UPI003F11811F
MHGRANVFAIHSWDDADALRRMEELLRVADPSLAHYSVLPERAIQGTSEDVERSIAHRIAVATAVVVVNTPGLHQRETATFEMETAVWMGKRIIVVQPYGNFELAVPQVLDGHVYRYATWRSDVVGRAIRGEYPQDGRVFDLAEVSDRRVLIGTLAAGVAAASFMVIARTASALQALQQDLAARGIDLRWDGEVTRTVVEHTLLGAGIGLLLGALSGDGKTAVYAAAGGAAIGAAAGIHRVYNARLIGTTHLRVLALEPV